jgi:hypothetical protein
MAKVHATEFVFVSCPICGEGIPVWSIHVETWGWWRRQTEVRLEGDSSDYVAHLWFHEQQKKASK